MTSSRPRRRRARRLAVVSVALTVGLFAAACGDDSDGGAAAPTTAAGVDQFCTPERVGGTLNIGTWLETGALDPVAIVGGTSGGPETAAIFDTLLRFNPSTLEYEPWVAESLTSNDAGDEWTLRLRSDVRFGNGDTLSAADVKASIERHIDPANSSRFRALVTMIDSMRVVDDLTLVFSLEGPDGTLPNVLADVPGMITNPRVVEELGDRFKTLPVGGGVGPYEPVRFATGEEIVMRARSDYWAGPVCIEEIRFKVAPDDATRLRLYEGNQFLLTWLRDPVARDGAKSVSRNTDPAFNLVRNSGGILAINNSLPEFGDLRVRQAMSLAIDADVVVERGYQGKARPSRSLIDSESALFTQDLRPQEYDVERAKALVEELKAAGAKTSFNMVCPASAADWGLAVKTLLDIAGFSINLNANLAVPTFVQQVNVEANYELACQGLNIDDASPWVGFERFLGGGSPANFLKYENAEMDRAIAGMKQAKTIDELKGHVADAQRVFNDTIPAVALFPAEQLTVVSPRVQGVIPTLQSLVLLGRAYLAQ